MVLAETAQVQIDLDEAKLAGTPYPSDPGYAYQCYLNAMDRELAAVREAVQNDWPRRLWRRIWNVVHEFTRVWTGSEHETAAAALHRAEGLYLMVAAGHRLRAEALKIESLFKTSNDIPVSDPRHTPYSELFARVKASARHGKGSGSITAPDRILLREVRREQNEAWEIARCRVRIFRNILTAAIPLLTVVLLVAAFIGSIQPDLVPLVPVPGSSGAPGAWDVATVEFLGALGGLLSAVATIRAARNFQRFYGLPLAQSFLKLPAGAASALAGVLLVQHGLLGSIGPFSRQTIFAYALIFGIAQIAVTKQIDTRAGDLLGEANAKSPATGQSTAAGCGGGDA